MSLVINRILYLLLFSVIVTTTFAHQHHSHHEHNDDNENHHHRHRKGHRCSHDHEIEMQQCSASTRNQVNYDNHPYDKTLDLSSIIKQNNQNPNESPLSKSRRSLLTDAETEPIRISAYYDPVTISTSNGLEQYQIDWIKELVAATINYYEEWVQVIRVSGALTYQACTDSFSNLATGDFFCYVYDTTCGPTEVPPEHMDPRLGILYERPGSVGTNSTRIFTPGAGI